LKKICGNSVTMLGNIPPRDVLARGTEAEITAAVHKLKNDLEEPSRVILSCGGGMPPSVTTAQISAFIKAAKSS
jgi:uroporphyrinogen-III decarboxylase